MPMYFYCTISTIYPNPLPVINTWNPNTDVSLNIYLKFNSGDITNTTYINDYSTGSAVAVNGLSGTYAISTSTVKVGTGSINFQTNASWSGLNMSKVININNFTITGWYYITGYASSGYPRFFCIRSGGTYIEIYLINNTTNISQESNLAGGNFDISTNTNIFTLNTWNHMAFVYDNSNGFLTTYINNNFISKKTFSKFNPFNSSNISISVDPQYPNSQYIIGYVDDWRFYSYALSASQINIIYNLT